MIQENVDQTGMNQKKPRNIWKIFSIGMLLLALTLSAFIFVEHFQLEEKTAEFSALAVQYDNLQSNLTKLQSSYSDLQTSYSVLGTSHSNLQDAYYTMNDNYKSLKEEYDLLLQNPPNLQNAFARTLEKKQVPTLSELQNWLTLDQADTMDYNDPDFVCTDFAAMLVVHARTQEWQMGLVFVYGNDTSTH